MTEWTEQRFAALDIDEQYGEDTVAKQRADQPQQYEVTLVEQPVYMNPRWIGDAFYSSLPRDYQNAFAQQQMAGYQQAQQGIGDLVYSNGTTQLTMGLPDPVEWQWDAAMDEYVVRKRINGEWKSYRTSSIEDAVRQYYAWA